MKRTMSWGARAMLGLLAVLLVLPALALAAPVAAQAAELWGAVPSWGGYALGAVAALGIGLGIVVASPEGPDGEGVALAQAGVPQGLFGNATLQPANPAQAEASFGLGQSAVCVYVSTQTPAAVAANTTAEQAFTVTGILAGSVVYVNKPTVQAGLGIVNARVSAADTIQVCFSNSTGGNITPTAGEEYLIVEIRGPLVQTVALVFGTDTVPANGTREFVFDITPAANTQGLSTAQVAAGVPVTSRPLASAVPIATTEPFTTQQPAVRTSGTPVLSGTPQTVIVNKPTTDAGVGICGVRLSANNQLALRFCNVTAGAVNPADETYTFIGLRGVALHQSIVQYIVDCGAWAAVAQGVTVEQTKLCNGLRVASDRIVGVSKPTAQAGLGIVGWRVTADNTFGITWANVPNAGGNLTPTADEHYTLWVDRSAGGDGGVLFQFSTVIQPGAVAADTVAEQVFTVTGLPAGCPVVVNVARGSDFAAELGTDLPFGLGVVSARTSALNTLALGFLNTTANAITPPQLMVTVLAARPDRSGAVDGVDGSGVVWPLDVQSVQLAEVTMQVRRALVALGGAAGA